MAVFLNGCKTLSPLGEQIVEALPHLSVIGWGTVTADQAATAFAQVATLEPKLVEEM